MDYFDKDWSDVLQLDQQYVNLSIEPHNLVYQLQFSFRKQCSMFHALISLTEDITTNLDKGNIGCGIFVDLQKPFGTVEHNIFF